MHEEDDEAAIEYKGNEGANKMVDSGINNHQKLGETNSRQNCPDFSNEVILDPKGLKFGRRNCTEESIELKPIVHEVPIMELNQYYFHGVLFVTFERADI